jgi:ABC-type Fe3+-hydroxamate transport system substrate-binding protein
MRLMLVLPVVLALALSACGADDPGEPAGAAVTHKFGTTQVPPDPQRVVTVGYTDQDAVLALGVKPVAVGDFLGGYDWRRRPWAPHYDPKVVAGQKINFEAVAAQRPDLIIAINAGLKKPDYQRLSRIAPTVAQSGEYIDFGMPWEEQTRLVGRALGREARADRLIANLEAKFARVREEHPEFEDKPALLAYGGPDGYGAYATGDTRSRLLTDLGFKLPSEIDKLAGDSFYAGFSQEQFRLLDQDLVVMYGPQKSITHNPVVRRLDAVEDDRIVYLDLTDQLAGALGFASVLSLDWVLEHEVDALAAAADGDPATKVDQPT